MKQLVPLLFPACGFLDRRNNLLAAAPVACQARVVVVQLRDGSGHFRVWRGRQHNLRGFLHGLGAFSAYALSGAVRKITLSLKGYPMLRKLSLAKGYCVKIFTAKEIEQTLSCRPRTKGLRRGSRDEHLADQVHVPPRCTSGGAAMAK